MFVPLLHLKKGVSKYNLHLQWPNPSIFPLPSIGFTKSCSRTTELLQQGQFNLEMENTESGLLIYMCCLNYGSLGRRKVFEALRGGGHPEKQRPGMCTEFCAGPAPVGSPVGTCVSAQIQEKEPKRHVLGKCEQSQTRLSTKRALHNNLKSQKATVSISLGTPHF